MKNAAVSQLAGEIKTMTLAHELALRNMAFVAELFALRGDKLGAEKLLELVDSFEAMASGFISAALSEREEKVANVVKAANVAIDSQRRGRSYEADAMWTALAFGCTAYVVFWLGHSGWWFVVAAILCASSSLIDVLKKRYGIAEEKEAK